MIFTIAYSRIGPYYASLKEVLRDCSNGPEYHPKRTKIKGYQKCKRRK